MNWTATGVLVGVIGVSFAAGAWVTSSGQDLQVLERKLVAIEDKVESISPSGMVAFFEKKECPGGWTRKESIMGRYVVGASSPDDIGKPIGSALKRNEDRPAGAHTHSYQDDAVGHNASNRYEGLLTQFKGDSSVALYHRSGTSGGVVEGVPQGTNSPYIQLTACVVL